MSDPTSIWSPLRSPRFLGLWAYGGVYFLGNAMQSMATAWLMVELSGSSFLAALVQTAVFLPMFLLALPAGVLADTTDRRRLLLGALYVQAGTVAVLALLILFGLGHPSTLLLFTFVAGCCTAMLSPAWNSMIGEAVPREELPQAITAVGIAYNSARALGPALAGLLFGLAGGGWVMVLTVAATGAMIYSIRRWPPAPHPPSRLPPERLWRGTLSALRYARHSETILAQMVRTVAFGAAGSALWALLPVIGQRQLGLGAEGYGMLMGCLGGGAVAAGLGIGRLRARAGLEGLVTAGCILFALAMLVTALSSWAMLVFPAMVVAGAAWMSVFSTFNTATQTSAPPWVRSRATAMHILSALGSFAIGSAIWGALSGLFGLPFTLSLAAAIMAANVLLRRRFPLRMGERTEVQAAPWEELLVADEPDPEAGPVAVEIAYRINPDDAERFLDTIEELRAPRRRDGASLWRVYRDLSDSSRYVERFVVDSWAAYLHQRARATVADHEIEARVREFVLPNTTITIDHFVAER